MSEKEPIISQPPLEASGSVDDSAPVERRRGRPKKNEVPGGEVFEGSGKSKEGKVEPWCADALRWLEGRRKEDPDPEDDRKLRELGEQLLKKPFIPRSASRSRRDS